METTERVKRIVETQHHLYWMEYTPGWLKAGEESPNDVTMLGVDGKYVGDQDEDGEEIDEIALIHGIGPEEHKQILAILTQYEAE